MMDYFYYYIIIKILLFFIISTAQLWSVVSGLLSPAMDEYAGQCAELFCQPIPITPLKSGLEFYLKAKAAT